MNCVLSDSFLENAYSRVKKVAVGESVRPFELFLMAPLTTSGSLVFDTKENKNAHPMEVLLPDDHVFYEVGAELGYIVIPSFVENAVTKERLGETVEMINFGSPVVFGNDYQKYDTIFDADLKITTDSDVRVSNVKTRQYRFVPPFQKIGEKEVALRKNYDAVVHKEPFISYKGGVSNIIELKYHQTKANLNDIDGKIIYGAYRMVGFIDWKGNTKNK